MEACTSGHRETVEMLLEHGSNPSQATMRDQSTPVILASLYGHAAVVELLLQKGADATAAKTDGFNSLRAACGNGHAAVVSLLLQHLAVPAGSAEARHALASACANGQLAVARILIEHGIPATAAAADGTTALMQACMSGHREVAVLLLVHGADVEGALATCHRGLAGVRRVLIRARLEAAAASQVSEARDLDSLVQDIEGKSKASPSQRPRTKSEKAATAAESGKAGKLRSSVEADLAEVIAVIADAAADASHASSPRAVVAAEPVCEAGIPQASRLAGQLLQACGRGTVELVSLLLAKRADPDHRRASDGWSPVIAACSSGHLEVVRVLLEQGADVKAAATDGFTPIFEACANGHFGVVELLLQHTADASQVLQDGTSPLLLASLHGHKETAALLLSHGADVAQARPCGFSSLRAACANGHVAVVELLLQHGANIQGQEGADALVSACANGHLPVVRLLLEKGVPAISASDGDDLCHEPLMKACIAGHREVASLLIANGADVDKVLAAAKSQNSLSGVRRVIGSAQAQQSPFKEETRDLDALVREIEGPASASKPLARGQGRGGKGSAAKGGRSRGDGRRPAGPLPESSADEEDGEEDAESDGEQPCDQRPEAPCLQEVNPTGEAPLQESQARKEPDSCLSARAAAFFQINSARHRLASAQGAGSLRHMPLFRRAPGTFYTVEVLGVEEASSAPNGSDWRSGLSVQVCGRGAGEPRRGGGQNRNSDVDSWARNTAVVAARCQGRPGAELALIPLSASEMAELSLLVKGGLPGREAGAWLSASPAGSSPPSAPSSLPDRDAPEEYAAWCKEAHRQCKGAAGELITCS
ncbi:unnamed protein product [Polarella glacialis]|uniref:PARP n=1 Tax=Polarella glacialis TaxID=89957 RepID=A0A813FNR8_POLGL|nr:unnamed protein product [Polarella glacialis]